MPGKNSAQMGATNRLYVRLYFEAHPDAGQIDCANALSLSPNAVSRHVKALAKAAGCRPRQYPAQAARKETL